MSAVAVMTYRIGDASVPTGEGLKVIPHVVNNRGIWGAGFVKALSARNLRPEEDYRYWATRGIWGNQFKLGNILMSPYLPNAVVVHMVAQDGVGPDKDGHPPIRYVWLTNCLLKTRRMVDQMIEKEGAPVTVHMPRIGCGLAGGDWARVGPLVQHFLADAGIPVFVYDLK